MYANQYYHVDIYTLYFLSFFLCGTIFFLFISSQMMWRAQNRLIDIKNDLISAHHFYLSEGVRGNMLLGDNSFY